MLSAPETGVPRRSGGPQRVLIVDDDPDIARFIQINLRLEGFAVEVARDGPQALAAMAADPPDLALIDVMMPSVDGVEVCRRLRQAPATAHLPVILLTAKSLAADKVVGLTAGADDYISKPFDTLELVARVRSTLCRYAEVRGLSPLTGLPGNTRIDAELAHRATAGPPFAVCYADLDNFKSFNDAYGFLTGDRAIGLLADALATAAVAAGEPVPFLGHVGGDDFVLICTPEQAEPACALVLEIVDRDMPRLHDPADVARGHLELVDRQGIPRAHPLVTVSIGIAVSGRRRYDDYRELVAVATEMKCVAKHRPGSAIAVDRRGDG